MRTKLSVVLVVVSLLLVAGLNAVLVVRAA